MLLKSLKYFVFFKQSWMDQILQSMHLRSVFCEIDSFQNDYVFKAVFSYSHSEVSWFKPTKSKKCQIGGNCILINTMSSSDDMSVRDECCSAKWLSAPPVHLRKGICGGFTFMQLTIAANQGHSFGSASCPPTMRVMIFLEEDLAWVRTRKFVFLPQATDKKPSLH